MAFTVPPLPYEQNALEPYMSAKTLSYHYGKHNQAYNDTLNKLIAGTEYEKMPLEEIIRTTQSGPIFNNAAQCFNHTFFWNSMKPNGGGQPRVRLLMRSTQSGAASMPLLKRLPTVQPETLAPAGHGSFRKKTARSTS